MVRDFLEALLLSLPFLLFVWLVRKASCVQSHRYRQLFLPLVAVALGVFALAKFSSVNAFIERLLSLASALVPPLGAWLATVNVAYLEVVLFNYLLLLAFLVVKLVYRGLLAALAKPYERGLKGLFGRFYALDEEQGGWYLQETSMGTRRLMRGFFRAALVVAVVLFCLAHMLPDAPAFRNPFYPAFAVLVIGEVYSFLDGQTKQERRAAITVEDDQSTRVFGYAKLQKLLEHYFADRNLHAFSRSKRRAQTGSHRDFCDALVRSDSFPERMAGAYFRALLDQGLVGKDSPIGCRELDHDAVRNTVALLSGKSVVFASPFYVDFVPYLFFPMNAALMRNGRVLVVHGDENDDAGLAAFVASGLEFVTNVDGMWTIGPLSPGGAEPKDVSLVPFSALGDTKLILDNRALLADAAFVVVLDPSSMLATYQVGLSILAEHLSAGRAPTYCIFDRNGDGLVDSLSHALRTNLVEVGATTYAEGMSVAMLWDADGAFLQHRLFPDVAHYLGVGTELGLVALKGQAEKVSWAASDSVPLLDQRWIIGQYYGELFGFAEVPQEQLQVDERFEFYPSLWSMPKQPNRFVVVEDEACNLFEAGRQFATRGTDQAFVNVVAPNYLLRAYMVGNADMLAADPKAIPSLAPDFAKSERNVVFSLVMMMVQGDRKLSEDEVAARLRYAGVLDDRSVREALEGMLIEHFDASGLEAGLPESHVLETEVSEYVPALREIVVKRYYSLSDEARFSPCFRSLRNVPLVTEAPDGTELLLGARLYGHVHQLFLPGQFCTISGKYYEVVGISDETGITLRRAADHFTQRRYYRQLRRYELEDWSDGGRPGDMRTLGGIRIMKGRASIAVHTQGYLVLDDYGNVAGAKRVELSNVPARRYANKDLLRVDFEGASPQVVATLATVMSESFRTLYPKDHPFIAVLAPDAAGLPEGILYGVECPVASGSIYIVEDSLTDIGLLSSIDRNMERILELVWDYLDWHLQQMVPPPAPEPTYEVGPLPPAPPVVEKRGFFARLADRVRRLFGRGKKQPAGEEAGTEEAMPAGGLNGGEETGGTKLAEACPTADVETGDECVSVGQASASFVPLASAETGDGMKVEQVAGQLVPPEEPDSGSGQQTVEQVAGQFAPPAEPEAEAAPPAVPPAVPPAAPAATTTLDQLKHLVDDREGGAGHE